MKLGYTNLLASLLLAAGGSTTTNAFHTPTPRSVVSKQLGSTTVNDEVATIDTPVTDTSNMPDNIRLMKEDSIEELPLMSPAQLENEIFTCPDGSVQYWQDFQSTGHLPVQSNLAEITNISRRFATMDSSNNQSNAISYFVRHVARSGYFFVNAALGTVASGLHQRFLVNNNNDDGEEKSGFLSNLNSDIASRLILEAFLVYEQDYQYISKGKYVEPWDMKLNHRQSSPINVLTQSGRFVNEAIATLARRERSTDEDKKIWMKDGESKSKLYPAYYQNAFHYQSDGWMSRKSANVYETSTETLFLGRQDGMQRSALAPIIEYSKSYKSKGSNNDKQPMKVLEVACGTGRFMTFVRDNLPLDTECTAVDLSPFYLEKARDNDAYWRKTRREEENRKNGNNNIDKDDIKPLKLVQANAEELPFENESFDAVVCVYLYHELPRAARARVSSEMSRVLKKDGLLVLTDSIQKGDRPILDANIGNFEKMNEPYYVDYTEDDLPGHFKGLQPMEKTVRSTTKSLTFIKSE